MAAFGGLKSKQGYNQRCQRYQNLPWDKPNLHAKFHQNRQEAFGDIEGHRGQTLWNFDKDCVL